jgi:hypothetical protein
MAVQSLTKEENFHIHKDREISENKKKKKKKKERTEMIWDFSVLKSINVQHLLI